MTAPHTESASYEVGYGKPPRHTQFKKGQSGNPSGRPRERVGRFQELVLQEAYRGVIVMDRGVAVPMPAIQAVLRSQFELAAAGNVKAQRAILAMMKDIEQEAGPDLCDPADGDDDGADDADDAGAAGRSAGDDSDGVDADAAGQPDEEGDAASPPVQRWRQPPAPEPPPPVVRWRDRPQQPWAERVRSARGPEGRKRR
jgi:Family of unknown function (DUF5681)